MNRMYEPRGLASQSEPAPGSLNHVSYLEVFERSLLKMRLKCVSSVAVLFGLTLGVAAISTAVGAATCADFGNELNVVSSAGQNSGCRIGTTNNDSLGNAALPLSVNVDDMFSGGWSFLSRDNLLDGTDKGDIDAFTLTGDRLSGSFTFDLAGTDFVDALLVFTAGTRTDIVPANYVAYLFDAALIGLDHFLSGRYLSPFIDTLPDPDAGAKVYHVTLYGRPIPVQSQVQALPAVPLPPAIMMLASALAGLGFLGWRKSTRQG